MANLRLGVTALLAGQGDFWARVNWLGVLLLLTGSGLGFFADRLCERFSPGEPQRAVQFRLIGLGLAFAGTLWAMFG